MKTLITILLVSVALVACSKPPESSVTKGQFKVETLFTNEGCTVYRFEDGGHDVYYTNCRGETSNSYSCGKGCTHTDHTTTVLK
jgi:hypothetical protein